MGQWSRSPLGLFLSSNEDFSQGLRARVEVEALRGYVVCDSVILAASACGPNGLWCMGMCLGNIR
jgi:hypothetical protein